MGLYQSDWKPRGIRRVWEKTAIGNDDAEQVIRSDFALKADVHVTDAVAWWRGYGSLAVLAVDLTTGSRVIIRQTKRVITIKYADLPA